MLPRTWWGKQMHIPDGFISPKIYIPAYAACFGLWGYGIKRIKKRLDEETLPSLAVVTALAFVLLSVTIPLPGGTSVHAAGIGLLAVLFGIWVSFIAVSMVLLLQALLFGIGGVTSLPVNALAMGLAGSTIAFSVFSLIRRFHEKTALFAAGWLALNVSAFLEAVVLGLQPAIAHTPDGTPLFFPFDLSITIPAVMIPHTLVGIGEGALTVLIYRFVSKLEFRKK